MKISDFKDVSNDKFVENAKRLEECVKFINEDENLKRLNIEIEVKVCEQTKEL